MANREVNIIGYFAQQCPSVRHMGSDHIVKCMEVILSKFPICRIKIKQGASRTQVLGMYHDIFIAKNPHRTAEFDEFSTTTTGTTTTALELAHVTPQTEIVTRPTFQLHGFVVRKGNRPRRQGARMQFASAAPIVRIPAEINIIQAEEEDASEQLFAAAVDTPVQSAEVCGIASLLTREWNEF